MHGHMNIKFNTHHSFMLFSLHLSVISLISFKTLSTFRYSVARLI